MKTAADTALKEEAKMKEKEEEYISAHHMLEEEKLKIKEEKKKKAAAAAASKEETKRTANAPTADASEEEVRGGNENNQEKEGMKDNVTHRKINDHLRELNPRAGNKDDDTDKMEEDPLPRKKKSIENKKMEKDRKNKEKEIIQYPDPESSPSIIKEGQFSATGKAANKAVTTATK